MRILTKLCVVAASIAISTSLAYADTLGAGAIGIGPVFGQAQIQWTSTGLSYDPFGDAVVTSASGSLLSYGNDNVGVNGFAFSAVSAANPVEVFFIGAGASELEFFLTSIDITTDNSSQLDLTGSGYFDLNGTDTAATLIASASNSGTTSFEMTSNVTPEPSSLLLLGTGLLGAAGIARRKFASKVV